MQKINRHTKMLMEYMFHAPDEFQSKFYIYNDEGTEKYSAANFTCDSSFVGFIFREGRVLVYNIQIYDKKNAWKPKYLDITGFFNQMLRHYNIMDLCFVLRDALQRYYRESVLTDNTILYFKYYGRKQKHKFRYNVIKHRSRQYNFIEGNRNENIGAWDKILYKTIDGNSLYRKFREYRNERPVTLFLHLNERKELYTL